MKQTVIGESMMNAFEVTNSVAFGNKLAARIDAARKPSKGFRFDAAIRHMIMINGRREAAALAIRLASPGTDQSRIVADAIQHVNRLNTDQPNTFTENGYRP